MKRIKFKVNEHLGDAIDICVQATSSSIKLWRYGDRAANLSLSIITNSPRHRVS